MRHDHQEKRRTIKAYITDSRRRPQGGIGSNEVNRPLPAAKDTRAPQPRRDARTDES